ncbi:MAG TPA: DUF5117 domain-containing protein, partial [Gemmatimonadales bacterium]|nr:DUF5117 domain-containing protein [Gemmatimonadales bacterium]
MFRWFRAWALFLLVMPGPVIAQQSVTEYTRALEKRDGYFPLYWDAARGRLFLEIPRMGEEFLYLPSLATGVGSEPLGLDRGLIGQSLLARFIRVGPRVLLVAGNTAFRSVRTENAALVRSVEESFPVSTLGAFEVVAEEGGRALIDATAYFLTDVMDVRGTLRRGNAGAYQLDRERSAYHLDRTKAFPDNSEIEASLTFTTDAPGGEMNRHAPDGRAVTVRQHHSLVRLPPPGFTP